MHNTAIAILKNPPSMWWLEAVLSYVDSNHYLFDPLYMPPKPERNSLTYSVPNPDGFYSADNMPPALL